MLKCHQMYLTKKGTSPFCLSNWMASLSLSPRRLNLSSLSMYLILTSPMSPAFSTDEWAWSEQYATKRLLISASSMSGYSFWYLNNRDYDLWPRNNFIVLSIFSSFLLLYLLIASVLPANKHTNVDSEAVVWMTPPPGLLAFEWRKSSGSPIIWPSQSITMVSSSVHAGLEA